MSLLLLLRAPAYVATAYTRTASETLTTSDSARRTTSTSRRATDASATPVDSASRSAATIRTGYENQGLDPETNPITPLVDVRRTTAVSRSTTDAALAASDSARRVLTSVRTAGESTSAAEVARRAVAAVRTTQESASAAEAASRAVAASRTTQASTGTTEAATRSLAAFRAVLGLTGATDASTRSYATARSSYVDTTTIDDSATRRQVALTSTTVGQAVNPAGADTPPDENWQSKLIGQVFTVNTTTTIQGAGFQSRNTLDFLGYPTSIPVGTRFGITTEAGGTSPSGFLSANPTYLASGLTQAPRPERAGWAYATFDQPVTLQPGVAYMLCSDAGAEAAVVVPAALSGVVATTPSVKFDTGVQTGYFAPFRLLSVAEIEVVSGSVTGDPSAATSEALAGTVEVGAGDPPAEGAVFSDNFNRPDGNVGNGWTADSFQGNTALQLSIVNQQLNVGGFVANATHAAPVNGYVEVTYITRSGGLPTVNLRVTDNETRYVWRDDGFWRYDYDNTARTFVTSAQLSAVASTWNPGDRLRAEFDGDTFRTYVNGTLILTVVDDWLPKAAAISLGNDGGSGTAVWDDVVIGQFASTAERDPVVGSTNINESFGTSSSVTAGTPFRVKSETTVTAIQVRGGDFEGLPAGTVIGIGTFAGGTVDNDYPLLGSATTNDVAANVPVTVDLATPLVLQPGTDYIMVIKGFYSHITTTADIAPTGNIASVSEAVWAQGRFQGYFQPFSLHGTAAPLPDGTAGEVYGTRTDSFVEAFAGGVAGVNPPANDQVANAIALQNPTPYIGSTAGATASNAEEALYNTATVWFTWRPAPEVIDQVVAFDTIGSDFDTVISLYSGPAGATTFEQLSYFAGNDEGGDDVASGGNPHASYAPFAAEDLGDRVYYIAVGGYYGDTGNYVLNYPLAAGGEPPVEGVSVTGEPTTVLVDTSAGTVGVEGMVDGETAGASTTSAAGTAVAGEAAPPAEVAGVPATAAAVARTGAIGLGVELTGQVIAVTTSAPAGEADVAEPIAATVDGPDLYVTTEVHQGAVQAYVIDRSQDFTALTLLDTVTRQPGLLRATIGNGKPDYAVKVWIDGQVVLTDVLDSTGTLLGLRIPVAGLTVGEHQIGVTSVATDTDNLTPPTQTQTIITTTGVVAPEPQPAPLMPATVSLGRWAFQTYDLDSSGVSRAYTLPLNPQRVVKRFGELAISDKPVVHGGRIVSWEGTPRANTWSWSGNLLNQADYEALDRWAALGQRIYLTDHHGDRYLVKIATFETTRKRDMERPWHHTYDMTVWVLSGAVNSALPTVKGPMIFVDIDTFAGVATGGVGGPIANAGVLRALAPTVYDAGVAGELVSVTTHTPQPEAGPT